MKQIEQHPRDYRAVPLKGEPVFVPGGLKRLGYWLLALAFSMAVCWVVSVIIAPLEPFVRGLI